MHHRQLQETAIANESLARLAIPRSESIPSKYPTSNRKYRPGARLGHPITGA
jgi:hypothetical protein